MPRSRIRLPLLITSVLASLSLLVSALSLVLVPPGGPPAAQAATRVAKSACRHADPNLVNGVCLRYRAGGTSGLTWIGSYRAPDGRVFFCIDYLYDSRLPHQARVVSTQHLRNQLGRRVGDPEVSALNYLVSRWAGHGSTGSDDRDAAIALIVREVMSDGVRPGGAVVYPRGLEVGERVRPPVGGLGGSVMSLARHMWQAASARRGPYEVSLDPDWSGRLRLGDRRHYRLGVLSAAGEWVPGVLVRLTCTGPVTCPRSVTTRGRPREVAVRPRDLGRFRISAVADLPSSDGLLYQRRGWHGHGGTTARDAGTQRGWIAQENRARAAVTARATVEKARPRVVTATSHQRVTPGATIHDLVTVSELPAGYEETVVASLYGPYAVQPGRGDCRGSERASRVRFRVDRNGTFRTPSVPVPAVGYYTWVENLPGGALTRSHRTRCGVVEETTRVVPFTPQITTTVSRQRAEVGDRLHDRVELGGVGGTEVTLAWTLYGPLSPRHGECRRLDWDDAAVVARGRMTVPGDGTYRTPSTRVERAGCHTYAQEVLATPLSAPATSPPGLVPETALVRRRTPEVTTVVSRQRALVGATVHDAVKVGGLRPDDVVAVHWRLHGPLAPRHGSSCRGLSWGRAPVADHGSFHVRGSGSHRTRGTTIRVAGCYSYSQRLLATAATEPALSKVGLPVETALVTRPVTPYVPEIPSGAPPGSVGPLALSLSGYSPFVPATRAEPRYLERWYEAPADGAPHARSRPGRLQIARVRISAPVASVGLDRGAMAIPDDRHSVGWLDTTATVGDRAGSAVISGHVSDRHDRPGALWRLGQVRVGDIVRWEANGRTARFVVSQIHRYPRARGVPASVFRTDGRHLLRIVSCADRQRSGGRFHYTDNLVVTAVER